MAASAARCRNSTPSHCVRAFVLSMTCTPSCRIGSCTQGGRHRSRDFIPGSFASTLGADAIEPLMLPIDAEAEREAVRIEVAALEVLAMAERRLAVGPEPALAVRADVQPSVR